MFVEPFQKIGVQGTLSPHFVIDLMIITFIYYFFFIHELSKDQKNSSPSLDSRPSLRPDCCIKKRKFDLVVILEDIIKTLDHVDVSEAGSNSIMPKMVVLILLRIILLSLG